MLEDFSYGHLGQFWSQNFGGTLGKKLKLHNWSTICKLYPGLQVLPAVNGLKFHITIYDPQFYVAIHRDFPETLQNTFLL